MKKVNIRFFSPTDNSDQKTKSPKGPKSPNVKIVLSGYVSSVGKLVMPTRTVANLGLDLATTRFKVGMDQDKRKAKSLYLVPSALTVYG